MSAVSVIILVLICLFITTASALQPSDYYQPEIIDGYYQQYAYEIIELSRKTSTYSKEKLPPYVNKSSEDIHPSYTANEHHERSSDADLEAKATLWGIVDFKGSVSFHGSNGTSETQQVPVTVKPHKRVIVYEQDCVDSILQQIIIKIQRAPLSDPTAWTDYHVETEIKGYIYDSYKQYIIEEETIEHEEDKTKARDRAPDGQWTYYYCKIPGCPCENNRVPFEIDKNHQCANEGATCTKPGKECPDCGRYGTTLNHDYDYEHPAPTASRYVVYYYCKNDGCSDYISHSHQFKTVEVLESTVEYKQIPDDYVNHQEKVLELQECECGETIIEETWPVKPHYWNLDEGWPKTCLEDGYERSVCACGMELEELDLAPGRHEYDYAHPETTSTGFRFPCKYGCAGAYDDHSHNYVDAGEEAVQTKNYQKYNDTIHKRRYDIRMECNCKLGNGAKCPAGSKWRYEWREEEHSSWSAETTAVDATCTSAGYKTHTCNDCQAVVQSSTIAPHGHKYDYTRPETTSTGFRFPCKYGCAGAYNYHSHNYVDAGEAAVWTNNLQKSNDTYHKRRYDIKRVCNSKWGNGAKCPASTWRYEWRDEKHNPVKDGDATPTESYTQITGNTSQHKRLYRQPQKCACGQTSTASEWRNQNHNWVQKGETHGNCVTPTVNWFQCGKCSMTKSENGAKDSSNHIGLATRYTTVVAPTCVSTGSGYYPCSACGGQQNTTIPKDPNAHYVAYWVIVQTPTASNPGRVSGNCTRCGKTLSRNAR